MSEPMSTKEGLTSTPSAGQSAEGPAQLPTGGQHELAATHAENAGLPSSLDAAEPRDLTPQDVERMFGPAQSPLERLVAQGVQVVEGPTEMGGGGAEEADIRNAMTRHESVWSQYPEAERDRFAQLWLWSLKAQLGVERARQWCQKNNYDPTTHAEAFRRLAVRRRREKMTKDEIESGLTPDYLLIRDALPSLLNDPELLARYMPKPPQLEQTGGVPNGS